MVYWKVFGSSGIIERDTRKLIPEQFVIAYPKMTDVGKCFFNTDYEYAQGHKRNSIMHHVLWSKCGGFVIPPVNLQNHISFPYHHHINNQLLPMQINHYVTKSYQDYYYKTHVKTDVYFENNPRKMEQFYNIDAKCTVADYRIFRFLSQLKQALKTEE